MKFKFLNKKKLVVILLSSIAITNFTACNKEGDKIEIVIKIEEPKNTEEPKQNEIIEDNKNEQNLENNPKITIDDIKNEINEIKEDDKDFIDDIFKMITQSYSDNDEVIINELENINKQINEIKEDDKEFLNDIKLNFLTCIDFVFYGAEINGVKFEDLTLKGKQKALELISNIDNSIETKYPNYKNEISKETNDILNKISTLIKEGSVNIDNFTKTKLTEEEYNNLNNAKNDIIEYSKSTLDKVKDYSIELYEDGKQKIIEFYNNFKK